MQEFVSSIAASAKGYFRVCPKLYNDSTMSNAFVLLYKIEYFGGFGNSDTFAASRTMVLFLNAQVPNLPMLQSVVPIYCTFLLLFPACPVIITNLRIGFWLRIKHF